LRLFFAVQVKGWRLWQRNRNRQQRRAHLRGVMAGAVTVVAIAAAAGTVAEATAVAVMAVRGVKAGRVAQVQADHVVESANIFAKRKSASFA
jgi:hypothetical protein